jgi:lipid II:glycine glycyltransferase (peptidoglycan interpeptide bridge formation enzyme)
MVELRQTKNYAKYLELLGWKVDYLEDIYIYTRKLPLLGNFIKIQRPGKLFSQNFLNKIIKLKHPFIITIEPLNSNQEQILIDTYKFKKTKESSLPSRTISIDLKKSEQQLLTEMHHKTRYNIKMAEKRGIAISTSEDIELFSNFWHISARKRGLFLSMNKEILSIYKAFGKNALIFLAKRNDSVVGGILLLLTAQGSYYMYAAANEEGKKNFAPTLLAWETIKYAKGLSKDYYDFEGIYDERFPIKSWKGFSRFKISFGGNIVEYPGIISKNLNPIHLW